MSSMPAIRILEQRMVLNPSIGRVMRLMARWSLGDVVEVFGLAHHDGQAAVSLNARDRSGVGAALVDVDLLGHAMQVDGAFEECPGRCAITFGTQREIDGVAVSVDRSIQIPPLARDLDWRSSIRQLEPTGRLRRRKFAANTGNILIDQRCKAEWSTKTPRSAIIFSMFRKPSG
jgi:hypothetical protein